MLFYTGVQRTAHDIIEEQLQRTAQGQIDKELNGLSTLVTRGLEVLYGSGPLDAFGELLHEGWMLKRRCSGQTTNSSLDELYTQARSAGATGGKLSAPAAGGSSSSSSSPTARIPSVKPSPNIAKSVSSSKPPAAPSSSTARDRRPIQTHVPHTRRRFRNTRLASVVADVPKPMAQVAGHPFLEYLIAQAKQGGCTEIILCVKHLAPIIEKHFGDGSSFGIPVRYSHEKDLAGTAGAIKLAEPLIHSNPFIVMNGDSYCDADIAALVQTHLRNNAKQPSLPPPSPTRPAMARSN